MKNCGNCITDNSYNMGNTPSDVKPVPEKHSRKAVGRISERGNRKGVFIPLVISSVTTGILPLTVFISNMIRTRLTAGMMGTNALSALSIYSNVLSLLSYLLYAAAIITIAASAVYAYANNPLNKTSERT
ncbi:MAG: hypothetical protein PUI48_01950 [Oscillospiraceae bacterium]|nr:hypothetical protein [Oscillospiraceae bacterium]MDY6209406.1 hypothetical protein [Oscillospiraceae bacterium]